MAKGRRQKAKIRIRKKEKGEKCEFFFLFNGKVASISVKTI